MKQTLKKNLLLLVTVICMVCSLSNTAQATSTAIPLAPNSAWTSASATDVDNPVYYSITLDSPGRLALSYQSFASHTYWGLYSEDLKKEFFEYSVSGGSSNSPQSRQKILDLEPGTYLVKIYPLTNSYGGEVSIKSTFQSVTTDDVEPNNVFANAMPLEGNKQITGFFSASDDCDIYKVSVPNTGTIEFKIATSYNMYYTIYNANFEEVNDEYISTYSSIVTKTIREKLTSGSYYVKLENAIDTGCYQFLYNNIVPTAIQLEPSTLTLTNTENISITPTIVPENAVMPELEWSSSNQDVVDITSYNGKDYFRKQGYGVAILTLSTTDGSNISGSCKVISIPEEVQYGASQQTKNSITLTWEEQEGVAGYRVFKYNPTTKKYVKYKDTTKDYLKIKNLKAETKYKFRVASYIKVDGETVFGESFTNSYWTAPKVLKATKITSIKKYNSNAYYTFINVKWKKVKGATKYQVYGKIPGGSWELLTTTKKTSTKLFTGKGYTYSIRVRPYRTKHNLTTYGKWSKSKKYTSR